MTFVSCRLIKSRGPLHTTEKYADNNGSKYLIEIDWGNPMTFVLSPSGGTKKFTTIEQARYWLRKKWPVADHERDIALDKIDAAMHCLEHVGVARKAFIAATKTAGFEQEQSGVEPATAF